MLITATEIIKRSFILYKENWKEFLKYAGLLLLSGFVTAGLKVVRPFFDSFFGIFFSSVFSILIGIALSIISLMITIALIKVIMKLYKKQEIKNVKEEIFGCKEVLLGSILVSILTALIIVGGAILLIIPGIIFFVWLSFSLYIVVLENKSPIVALKTSKSLVENRFFPVFWRLIAPLLVFILIIAFSQWIVGLPIKVVFSIGRIENLKVLLVGAILVKLVGAVVSTLATPLTVSASVILYDELKNNPHKEEIDTAVAKTKSEVQTKA